MSQWFGSADPDQNITDLQHNDVLDPVAVVRICGFGPKNITDPEPDPNIDPDP